jgi:phosphatidylserine synthase
VAHRMIRVRVHLRTPSWRVLAALSVTLAIFAVIDENWDAAIAWTLLAMFQAVNWHEKERNDA